MKTKKNLSAIEYVTLVNGIVSDFFSSEGEYTPHIGNLNAMRLFYNHCVEESSLSIPHDFEDASMIDILAGNEEFVEVFNTALVGDNNVRLDFSNAYSDALKIVDARKGSSNNAVNIIKNAIANIVDMINPIFSEENIEKIQIIADSFANGDISADKIVEAFGNSQRLKDITKSE